MAVGDIATAPDGSVYVMGIGWSTVVFGAGEPTETVVDFGNDFYLFSNTTIIIAPVFLAHFAADGALEWIEIVANYYLPSGFPLHVDADADGAVVSASYSELIGTTMTPMVLGVGSLREASPPVAGGADAFAARYRSSGSVAWIRHFGGPGSESIAGIALFDSGGALVAGRSPGPSITLGPGETNEETVAFSGAAGFFVRIGP